MRGVTQFIMCYVIPRILNLSFMFKVHFIDLNGNNSKFAELKTDVEAVQLALALHQSSNVSHNVSVLDDDDCEILTLDLSK